MLKLQLLKPVLMVAIALGTNIAVLHPGYAGGEGVTFECRTSEDRVPAIPVTSAYTPWGRIDLIEWKSSYFSRSKWNPEARCSAVTTKFQRYYSCDLLHAFTVKSIAGSNVTYPAIYVSSDDVKGKPGCSLPVEVAEKRLLFMLEPGQNEYAEKIRQHLEEIRIGGSEVVPVADKEQ